jgi:phosphoribosylformylglycinamidine synthase
MLRNSNVIVCRLGTIESSARLVVTNGDQVVMEVDVADAKAAWQKPLDW